MEEIQTDEQASDLNEESAFLQDETERDRRPRRQIRKPGRYKDFGCCRNERQGWQTGGEESGRIRSAPRKPIPRPCRYCGMFLEGR